MPTPAVEVLGLTRIFRPRIRSGPPVAALSNLSFSVAAGSVVALTGANGAGKTTLLDILATLLLPSSGDARVFGQSVQTDGRAVRAAAAYCPAGGSSFWPRLTGRENLECFAALASANVAGIAAACDRVGLSDDVLARETRTYSDGQLQRLNLARALTRDARLWLFDEPTRSLDVEAQAAAWTLIRDAARERGVTVVVATHDAAAVSAFADEVVRLS